MSFARAIGPWLRTLAPDERHQEAYIALQRSVGSCRRHRCECVHFGRNSVAPLRLPCHVLGNRAGLRTPLSLFQHPSSAILLFLCNNEDYPHSTHYLPHAHPHPDHYIITASSLPRTQRLPMSPMSRMSAFRAQLCCPLGLLCHLLGSRAGLRTPLRNLVVLSNYQDTLTHHHLPQTRRLPLS